MSGGFFDYQQHRLEDMAGKLDEVIARSGSPIEYGEDVDPKYAPTHHDSFPPDILARFRETAHELRRVGDMLQRVDWLMSGDDGEGTFRHRWSKEVRPRFSIEGDGDV